MREQSRSGRGLQAAREVFAPTLEQRDRVRAALEQRLVIGPRSVEQAASTPAPSTSNGARVIVKGGALLGIGFALGVWFAGNRAQGGLAASAPSAIPTDVPSLAEHSWIETPTNQKPATEPTFDGVQATVTEANAQVPPAASQGKRAQRTRTQPPAATTSTAEELSLLQRAQRAIRAGDGTLARSFVAELEARFPKTIWREERSAILILAACALREPGAQRGAIAFVRRQATSVYVDRIRAYCGLDAKTKEAIGGTAEDG